MEKGQIIGICVLILMILPLLQALGRGPRQKTGVESVVGGMATVIETFTVADGEKVGRVDFQGESWRATLERETTAIPAPGVSVQIVEVRGLTLVVKPE